MDAPVGWCLRPVAEPVSYLDPRTGQWTSGSFETAVKSEQHAAVVTSPAAAASTSSSSAFAAAAQHDTPADTPVDDLQRMLADKARNSFLGVCV